MHVRRDETCAASTLQIVPSSTQAEDLLRLRARSIRLGMTRWRAVFWPLASQHVARTREPAGLWSRSAAVNESCARWLLARERSVAGRPQFPLGRWVWRPLRRPVSAFVSNATPLLQQSSAQPCPRLVLGTWNNWMPDLQPDPARRHSRYNHASPADRQTNRKWPGTLSKRTQACGTE